MLTLLSGSKSAKIDSLAPILLIKLYFPGPMALDCGISPAAFTNSK